MSWVIAFLPGKRPVHWRNAVRFRPAPALAAPSGNARWPEWTGRVVRGKWPGPTARTPGRDGRQPAGGRSPRWRPSPRPAGTARRARRDRRCAGTAPAGSRAASRWRRGCLRPAAGHAPAVRAVLTRVAAPAAVPAATRAGFGFHRPRDRRGPASAPPAGLSAAPRAGPAAHESLGDDPRRAAPGAPAPARLGYGDR